MKFLYITTISGTMIFFPQLIRSLLDDGHTVEIACSETEKILPCYEAWGCKIHAIDCSRSPFKFGNIKAIGQIRRLVETEQYDLVHCHTPVAAACTRLACRKLRKTGTKVVYTAHGFHFFKGAPLINWLVYYPVEKLCAHFTDLQITINKEDYERASKKLKAKRVEYVPGVGIDLTKFQIPDFDKVAKRRELCLPDEAVFLLSVGELSDRKNHHVIIRALAELQDSNLHYVLVGIGANRQMLEDLARELHVEQQVHFLGYRNDIPELCLAADMFCFPSLQEGLAVAPMEAMACGLPVVAADVRGINDYSEKSVTGYLYDPFDVQGFAKAIRLLADSPEQRATMGEHNRRVVMQFDVHHINRIMKNLYNSL